MTTTARFTRQVRLAEVGAEGQKRLGRVEVRVFGDGTSATVEELYLRGAGVRVVPAEAGGVDEPLVIPPWMVGLLPPAREVATGAYAALLVVRSVLGQDETPP